MEGGAVKFATGFWEGKDFWWYHGWGLTACWIVGSFLAIIFKKLVKGKAGLALHALTFLATDLTTLFLAGGAFYRVYPNISKFQEWAPLKQAHIAAGIVFTIFVLLQHLGGVTLIFSNKPGGTHRKFGQFVSFVMRMIAVFGWLLVREDQMALIIGVVAVLETIILLTINTKGAAPVKSSKDPLPSKYTEKPKRQ